MPAQYWKPVCRHYALVEASVAREAGFPVRVAVGQVWDAKGRATEKHATGQAYIDNQWVDLEFWHGYVIMSREPELRTIDKTYSLTQWAAHLETSRWGIQ